MKYRVIADEPVTVQVLNGAELVSQEFKSGDEFLAAPKHAQQALDAGQIEVVADDEAITDEEE